MGWGGIERKRRGRREGCESGEAGIQGMRRAFPLSCTVNEQPKVGVFMAFLKKKEKEVGRSECPLLISEEFMYEVVPMLYEPRLNTGLHIGLGFGNTSSKPPPPAPSPPSKGVRRHDLTPGRRRKSFGLLRAF